MHLIALRSYKMNACTPGSALGFLHLLWSASTGMQWDVHAATHSYGVSGSSALSMQEKAKALAEDVHPQQHGNTHECQLRCKHRMLYKAAARLAVKLYLAVGRDAG